jgi:protocatechuate 3,4-dioxygenase beta subunit
VLGPFHTHDADDLPQGDAMSRDPHGEPCLVLCSVKDRAGRPVPDVKIDIWETDSSGHYDVQYQDRKMPDGRAVMHSDAEGAFWFRAIKPVSYPIPHDGPVGQLLQKLHRHPYRPAHMHFMFEKPGWDHLITALYVRGDPYQSSDAVFGVKASLLCDFEPADEATAKKYGVEPGLATLRWDFVLVTEEESNRLREERSRAALRTLGQEVRFVNGLPVPDVD